MDLETLKDLSSTSPQTLLLVYEQKPFPFCKNGPPSKKKKKKLNMVKTNKKKSFFG